MPHPPKRSVPVKKRPGVVTLVQSVPFSAKPSDLQKIEERPLRVSSPKRSYKGLQQSKSSAADSVKKPHLCSDDDHESRFEAPDLTAPEVQMSVSVNCASARQFPRFLLPPPRPVVRSSTQTLQAEQQELQELQERQQQQLQQRQQPQQQQQQQQLQQQIGKFYVLRPSQERSRAAFT
eukprot:TRINITY_DN31069_c1_g1_i2.p1 TRINITY_DN31069_c1_g1~~TRINITY_DN31069_c1_g1_i2.p1  ORF type:complete len:178 (-),score=55.53 TRINITY_DN31069_c1_g1_i2:79-612(-)